MTVQNTQNKVTYLGNGVATDFSFSFPLSDKTDIKVYLTNTATNEEILVTSGYTVNLNNPKDLSAGGYVRYPDPAGTPLPTGWKITINRETPQTQLVVLPNQGAFPPKKVEGALDKLTMLIHAIFERLSRTFQASISTTGMNYTIPQAIAGHVLGWNSLGNGLINYPYSIAYVNGVSIQTTDLLRVLSVPSTNASAILEGYYSPGDGGGGLFFWDQNSVEPDNGGTVIIPNTNPATGRWKRFLTGSVINVKWFGAKGDGSTDDTAAIQSAINAIAELGKGTLYFPAGTYIHSTIYSPGNIKWKGEGRDISILKPKPATESMIVISGSTSTDKVTATIQTVHSSTVFTLDVDVSSFGENDGILNSSRTPYNGAVITSTSGNQITLHGARADWQVGDQVVLVKGGTDGYMEHLTIHDENTLNYPPIWILTNRRWKFTDCKVYNACSNYGVRVEGSWNGSINECWFNGGNGGGAIGILFASHAVVVQNCEIQAGGVSPDGTGNNISIGVDVRDSNGVTIDNCSIESCGKYGVYVDYDGREYTVVNIVNCRMETNSYGHIYVDSGSIVHIDKCRMSGLTGGNPAISLVAAYKGSSIRNCKIHHHGNLPNSYGIFINSTNGFILDNIEIDMLLQGENAIHIVACFDWKAEGISVDNLAPGKYGVACQNTIGDNYLFINSKNTSYHFPNENGVVLHSDFPGNVINVRRFGAKGDGVTDDTAAINAAISALVAVNGGTLFFPAGTYIHSTIYSPGNIKWKGEGRDISILKPKPATESMIVLCGSSDADKVTATIQSVISSTVFVLSTSASGFSLGDGVINKSRSPYNGAYITAVNDTQITLFGARSDWQVGDQIILIKSGSDGHIEGLTIIDENLLDYPPVWVLANRRWKITDCKVYNACSNYGIRVEGSWNGCIDKCWFYGGAGMGSIGVLYASDGVVIRDSQIQAGGVAGDGTGNNISTGVDVYDCTEVTIDSCVISSCGKYGVYVDYVWSYTLVKISNCQFSTNIYGHIYGASGSVLHIDRCRLSGSTGGNPSITFMSVLRGSSIRNTKISHLGNLANSYGIFINSANGFILDNLEIDMNGEGQNAIHILACSNWKAEGIGADALAPGKFGIACQNATGDSYTFINSKGTTYNFPNRNGIVIGNTMADALLWFGLNITGGTGSPEGVVTANVGSMYLRSDGGSNSTLYIKESGAGNTGWVAK